jgi:hypothetical protein
MLCKNVLKCIARGFLLQLSISGLWAPLSLCTICKKYPITCMYRMVYKKVYWNMLHYVWFFNEATVISCLYALVSSANLLGYHQRKFAGVPPTHKSQEMMKTCQTWIKQSNPKTKGREKGTRWKDPSPGKKKEPPTRADCKGTWTNQILKPSSQKHVR